MVFYGVYYNKKGKVVTYTKDSMTPVCDSAKDLKYELKKRMMKAFKKDTLTHKEDWTTALSAGLWTINNGFQLVWI